MTRDGEDFETMTQFIFQRLLDQDEVRNIDVQHDVQIEGKTATHQIDVYWKFALDEVIYQTVVECKSWASSVSQGELFGFKTRLDDIPGQPRGIFVTATGFQEGARKFAEAHGIILYVIGEYDEGERVIEVPIKLKTIAPRILRTQIVPDEEWARKEKQRLGLEEEIPIRMNGTAGEMPLYDEKGQETDVVADVLETLLPAGRDPIPPTDVSHVFHEPRFARTGLDEFPRIKLHSIEATVEQTVGESEVTRVPMRDPAHFIIENVEEGTTRRLDDEGNVIGSE